MSPVDTLVIGDEVWVSHYYQRHIDIFDTATGTLLRTLETENKTAHMIQVGDRVWSTSWGPGPVTTYDIETGEARTLSWLGTEIYDLAPVGDKIWALGFEDSTIAVVDTASGWLDETFETNGNAYHLAQVGDEVWVAGLDVGLTILDARSHDLVRTLETIRATSVLLVGNTVWVSTPENNLILDAVTGQVLDTILPGHPGRMTQVGDTIFVTGRSDNRLTIVDIDTHAVLQVLLLPSAPEVVTPVGEAIWLTLKSSDDIAVLSKSQPGGEHAGEWIGVGTVDLGYLPTAIAKIEDEVWLHYLSGGETLVVDPSTRQIVRTIPNAGFWTMTPASQSVWAWTGWEDYTMVGRVSSETGTVFEPVPIDLTPAFVSAVNDQVWISGQEGDIQIFDAATGASIRTMDIGMIGGVLALEDEVWISNTEEESIVVVDPESGDPIESIEVGGFNQMVLVGDHVWAMDYDRTRITVIDPKSRTIDRVIPVSGPSLLTVVGDTVWVSDFEMPSVAILDSSTADVVETLTLTGPLMGLVEFEDELWVLTTSDDSPIVVYRQRD